MQRCLTLAVQIKSGADERLLSSAPGLVKSRWASDTLVSAAPVGRRVPVQGALVFAIRHAMIVVLFFAVNKPALKEYQYAEVHHNTPPFIKIRTNNTMHLTCHVFKCWAGADSARCRVSRTDNAGAACAIIEQFCLKRQK
jgi:hypothetical protein